ncbi:hypothetical protein [Dickeya ananatis]
MNTMQFEGQCVFNEGDSFIFNTFRITERGDILVEISGDSITDRYALICRLQKENGRYSGCGVIEYSGNKSIRTDTVFLSIKESDISFSDDICMIKRGQWELKTPDGNNIYYFSGELERIMAD